MGARDIIAKLHHDEIRRRVDDVTLPGWDELAESARAYYYATADAVIAAVRAMPAEEQAELIGGEVEQWKIGGDVQTRAVGRLDVP